MIEMDDEITLVSSCLIEKYLPNLAPIPKRSSLETRQTAHFAFIGHSM